MFRLSRPLFQAVHATTRTAAKSSTGITGLAVQLDPLPVLLETYRATLSRLSAMPTSAVYRQGTEATIRHKLAIVERATANGANDVAAAERELDDGQIEESIQLAQDELSLTEKMIEWRPCVKLSHQNLVSECSFSACLDGSL